MDATGAAPAPLFRAPHGFRSPFLIPVARRLGYRVVGWTAGVWDTAKPGVERIVARSVSQLQPGRDPAAARRRRLRRRRRPLADGGCAAADPGRRPRARARVRDHLRAGLGAAPAAADGAAGCGDRGRRRGRRVPALHQARPEGDRRRHHRPQPDAGVRRHRREPAVGAVQGADLEGRHRRGRAAGAERRAAAAAARADDRGGSGHLHRLPAEHGAVRPAGRGRPHLGAAAKAARARRSSCRCRRWWARW